MIIAGDTPLLKKETFFNVVDFFKKKEADLVLVSTILEDAGTYGRLKRDKNGFISEIVEFLDATKKEREIKEINSGIYFIKKDLLMQTVMNLKNKNKKNEFYLTDIIKLAYNSQKKVIAYIENDFFSLIGVNSKFDLAIADKEMQNRIKKEFMLNGVEIINPDSVYIEFGAKIESDSVIFPNCFIGKNAVIKSGVTILPNCFINSMVKQNSTIQPFSKIL
jgi:bifunctional UDP-N-acetylglucosamine pyrophosphorylase/glucosamine-1-phosphate N-acetyltransferase